MCPLVIGLWFRDTGFGTVLPQIVGGSMLPVLKMYSLTPADCVDYSMRLDETSKLGWKSSSSCSILGGIFLVSSPKRQRERGSLEHLR